MPHYSHHLVYQSLTEALLERGHKITLITTNPLESEKLHTNVTLIDVSFSVENYHKNLKEFQETKSAFKMMDTFRDLVKEQIEFEDVQKLIKSDKKFDLLILENVGFSPFHAFGEYFKIPVIGINSADSSTAGHRSMGNEVNAVSHPNRIMPMKIAKSFFERFISCFLNLAIEYFGMPYMAKEFDKLTQKYFPNVKKNYYELNDNLDMLFINVNPILGYHRPILRNTIELGFLHIKPPKKLPEDLEKILNFAENGAIFMSFGTIAKNDNINASTFLEAFSSLSQTILWKYDGDQQDLKIPKNVVLRKWFPQADLLAHPNIKLFITHGGQQSLEEAISREVPMLMIPSDLSDQKANAIRAEERQIAKILNINSQINSNDIKNSISAVLNDESYRANIGRLKKLVEDAPMNEREKACWHVEYVIRNGGAKFLHYEQKSIPFYQYHYYDVIGVIFVSFLTILMIIWKWLKCCCCKKSKLKSD